MQQSCTKQSSRQKITDEMIRQTRSDAKGAENDLTEHAWIINQQGQQVRVLLRRTQQHGDLMRQVRRDYPHWTPSRRAVDARVQALTRFWAKDYVDAEKWLVAAYGEDDHDAGTLYFLAMAQYLAGKQNAAALTRAQGVALEKRRGQLPAWYWSNIYRIQGGLRAWIEEARGDPDYGIKVNY